MMVRATRVALLSAALPLAGCGAVSSVGDSVGGFFSHQNPNVQSLNAGANPMQMAGKPPRNASERMKVLPVASQDINCPEVTIADGGAALRVGGPDNPSVRYQFNIGDTARECDPAGPGQATLKVGVKGEAVIGPAGRAGTFSAPLRVTVTRQGDAKPVFSQTYRVEAATDGISAGQFRIVTDPIPLSMPTLQLADVYTITVGFENGGAPRPASHRRARKRAG